MLSRLSIWGWAAVALLAFGCNKSTDHDAAQATSAASDAASAASGSTGAAPTIALQDAKAVVTNFLEAFRQGDNETATKLLTKIARQKVEGTNKCVIPPVEHGAKIEVGDPEYRSADHDIADVPTTLIDLDAVGQPRANRATFVCRAELEGWRVAGLAAYVFEGEKPVLLNFEDPDQIVRQQQWLKEEMDRRLKQETAAPASGENSSQAEKKPQDAFRR